MFCALIVLMFGALQTVANMRLQELAKAEGEQLFSWQWSGIGAASCSIDHSDIIKKTETDAVVRVKGAEKITLTSGAGDNKVSQPAETTVACSAVLTFYRKDKEWMLGKVQFE